MECGSDIHKEDRYGEAALFLCESGNEAKTIVKYLEEHYANDNKVNKIIKLLYIVLFP